MSQGTEENNILQLYNDWKNGGRLDLLIDAIKAVTDIIPDAGAFTTEFVKTAAIKTEVDELVTHLYNDEKLYGNLDNDMAEDIPIKFTVIGGSNVQGTELMLTDGTIIESGSAVKKFHLNTLYVVSVSTANKISLLQLLYSDINTGVACTFQFTGGAAEDMVISAGHGLENDDKVVLKAGGGALPPELVDYRTYYVTGKSADCFQVALTSGGAAVEFTDDGGAAFWYPIESGVQTAVQSNLTKKFISMANVNNDAFPIRLGSPETICNKRLFVRALSETGSTISIGFLMGLHIGDV